VNKFFISCIAIIFLWISPSFAHKKPSSNYTLKTVVIDAGHGGKDGGCSGKVTREKDITLAIALKVGKYIEEYIPGVKVIYTRKNNTFIPLYERAAIANRNNADLFISIHCNSSKKYTSATGTETYVMGLDKSRENLNVARRENAVVLMEDDYRKNYDGFDLNNPESEIVFSLYQNAYLDQSISLASLIEDQFKVRAGRKSRGVKQESFLVLYKTAMPSVLVETGFLTNLKEEKYLSTKEGQEHTASAIYRAFKAYKNSMEGKSNANRGTSLLNDYLNPTQYKVQLYDAYESVELINPNFDSVPNIEIEENSEGVKQYVVAKIFSDYDEALNLLLQVQQAGFADARIVGYKKNKRLID